MVPRSKLRELSQFVVADVVEDQADLVVGLEKAANHSAIVEDLGSPFGNLLWKRAEEMKRFDHDGDLFTLFDTLVVWLPRIEDMSSVWEQDTADIIFGELESFEKLDCNPRFGRDSFFRLTSED